MLDDMGRTPLHKAAQAEVDSVAVVQALLDAGADVSLRSQDGTSPLDLAAGMGHVEIARALLEHGADVNDASEDGFTPLHNAAAGNKPEMVSLLCLNGADVDVLDNSGMSPLMLTAALGHAAAAARALMAGGADATVQHGDDPSPLYLAASHERVDVLMAMVEHGVDVNAPDGHSHTALHTAATANKAMTIEVLLGAGVDIDARMEGDGCTPLFLAAHFSNTSAVTALLKRGASVTMRTAIRRTPLHAAAANAGRPGAAAVVDLLLRWEADENAIDNDGQTPADMVGSDIEGEDSVAEEVERVRQLLANAPADRAWRRRGFLVLCRAHYPSGRVQLGHGSSHGQDAGISKRTRSRARRPRAEVEWTGVASMLMGVGADVISLMGDGADVIFETIVGYL
eukprot:g4733.t1